MSSRLLSLASRVAGLFEFVKFSHTIFALPFALMSMLVAGQGRPGWRALFWILVCMVGARTAAMCFNRLADWEIDKQNPRTALRHTLIPKSLGWALMSVSLALLVFGSWKLNPLCLYLSPLAIVLVLSYSLTKRFTAYSHFFLGLALSAAPMGAWAALRGELTSLAPWILAASVLAWVFGFDLIYATLDMEFDRSKGLYSFPARYGLGASLRLAQVLHIAAAVEFACFGWIAGLGWIYAVAWVLAAVGLLYEHRLCRTSDPASINKAFFHVNAFVSMTLLVGVCLDLWIRR